MTDETKDRLAIVAESIAHRKGRESAIGEVAEVRQQLDILKTALRIAVNHADHGLKCVTCLTVTRAIAQVEGKLLQLCSWCGAFIGMTPCDPKMAGEISHGICPPCYEQAAKGVARE